LGILATHMLLTSIFALEVSFLYVWTTFNKLETNAVQEKILGRIFNKYTSVYIEKIRQTCKAAGIRQRITDQLFIASPQEKTHPKPTPNKKYKVYRYPIQVNASRVYPVFVPKIPINLKWQRRFGMYLVRIGQ
jgi:hypothetical protein